MRTRLLGVVATLLAFGCVVAAPKSRLEPHERVAVLVRGETKAGLATPVAGAFMSGCLKGNRGDDAFALLVCGAIDPVLSRIRAEAVAADALYTAVGPLVAEGEFQTRFAEVVTTQLARKRSIAPAPQRADAILALRLHSLEVRQFGGGFVSLRLTAAARIESGGEDPGKARTTWRATEYERPARPYRDWIDSDGRALLDDIQSCIEHVADDLISGALHAGERPATRE